MIPESIPNNIYQDRFLRQIDEGESATEAIMKLIHRYLDGKPVKTGKRKLSVADRDLDFWGASFWDNVSTEIIKTEIFAIVLARYLRQNKITRSGWLQHLVSEVPCVLQRAIRYSQIFLFPTEPHWKEIKALNVGDEFSQFLDACAILQGEHRKLENAIKKIEIELKRLSPMEVLVYVSLFAFKNLAFSLGQQELKPDQLDKHHAETSRADFQEVTDAINQILVSKLKTSSHSDFFMSERIIGESLRKHMSPLLFPSPSTARAAEKCLFYMDTIESLVAAYLQFNEFIGRTINCFCFDEDYDIRFEGERLIVFPRVIPEESDWDRNGRKLDRLHQYWHFRATPCVRIVVTLPLTG